MDVDRVIHPIKSFGELDDNDVAAFLRGRTFKPERLDLEFKSVFPCKDKKYDLREICKDIVAFSNAQGGVVVYGVSASVEDPQTSFPDYVTGLAQHPSPEDLSQWVKERVHPPIDLPAMRFFDVAARRVAILKIPPGVDRPYCYYHPESHAISYFKRAADRVTELTPDEIRGFHRTSFTEELDRFLHDTDLRADIRARRTASRKNRVQVHQRWAKTRLENTRDFGFLGMYSLPVEFVDITTDHLTSFLQKHRFDFSEEVRYFPQIDRLQKSVSVGYFPRAIRQDIKSTYRITLYSDGTVALDSQADNLMDRNKNLHPFWLSYQIQRHLQLSRALLESVGVAKIFLLLELENIEEFSMSFQESFSPGLIRSPYSGIHEPIEREVALSEVHPFDSDRRNIVMPVVRDIMDEVCRIFGYSEAPPGLWDQNGFFMYVKGLQGSR